MYASGQLIWLKNIDNFSGKPVKNSRLCIVRRVYNENTIDLRVLSTIFFDKSINLPAKTLKEARKVLENLFEKKILESGQYVICEPEIDNTLNFSFTFGNMISKKVKLDEFIHEPLLDKEGNPLFVSEERELELSIKEAIAIADDIIKYFKIVPTAKNRKKKKHKEEAK